MKFHVGQLVKISDAKALPVTGTVIKLGKFGNPQVSWGTHITHFSKARAEEILEEVHHYGTAMARGKRLMTI